MRAQGGKLQMKSRSPSFYKFQQFINWLQSALQKKLQPEIEINEYSSSKKLLKHSSTRGSPTNRLSS